MLWRALCVMCVLQSAAIGWLLADRDQIAGRAALEVDGNAVDAQRFEERKEPEKQEAPATLRLPYRYRLVPAEKVNL